MLCALLSQSLYAEPLVNPNIARLLQQRACEGCDLQGVDLSRRDLSGVNLNSANLGDANLTQTNLRGAQLRHANLRGAQLTGTQFTGADLRYADLSDMDIDESFESMEIIGTLLEGAQFKDGVVCGKLPTRGGWGCQQP